MEQGGIERSLIELLKALDRERFRVLLLLFAHTGPLMAEIPEDIRLLPENPRLRDMLLPIKTVLKRRDWSVGGARLFAKSLHRLQGKTGDAGVYGLLEEVHYRAARLLPLPAAPQGGWDALLSYQWPHNYAARIPAKRKLAFIHTDPAAQSLNFRRDAVTLSAFDGIACVSGGALLSFQRLYPSLADRSFVFENLLSRTGVWERAEAFVPEDMPLCPDGPTLLSVGRLCYAKGFDEAIRLSARLQAIGFAHRWYILGGGTDAAALRSLAQSERADCIRFLGERPNALPYMKAADAIVQTSRYEGRCVAVMEALTLGKPVMLSPFPTALSHITPGVDGVLLPAEAAAAAECIAQRMQDKALLLRLTVNARARDVSGYGQLERLYGMLELQ
jgi:glycosyltransferase involved in cell wall biosynthesis